jgi:hypothetical protein
MIVDHWTHPVRVQSHFVCHAHNNVLRKQYFSKMHFSTPGVFINQLSLILSSFMKIEVVQGSVLNGTHEVTVQ